MRKLGCTSAHADGRCCIGSKGLGSEGLSTGWAPGQTGRAREKAGRCAAVLSAHPAFVWQLQCGLRWPLNHTMFEFVLLPSRVRARPPDSLCAQTAQSFDQQRGRMQNRSMRGTRAQASRRGLARKSHYSVGRPHGPRGASAPDLAHSVRLPQTSFERRSVGEWESAPSESHSRARHARARWEWAPQGVNLCVPMCVRVGCLNE